MPSLRRAPAPCSTLVIGESLVDVVVGADGTRSEHVGGSPLNVAVGLARLDHRVTLATHFGRDAHGAAIGEHLAEAGVDLISSGWITHSAPVLDLGLDIEIS